MNPVKIILDLLNFSLILLNFLTIPFIIAFQLDEDSAFVRTLKNLNFLLIIEILIKFRTEYYSHGILITNPQKILKNCLKKDLFFELLSIIFLLIPNDSFMKLFFLLKFRDFLRIQNKYIDLLFFTDFFEKILKLLVFLLNFFVLVHFLACFWLRIGSLNSGQNWLIQAKINTNSFESFELYLISLFWVVSLMISKPDFQRFGPCNNSEYVLCIFLQILSFFFLIYAFFKIKNLFDFRSEKKTLRSLRKIGNFKGISALGNEKIMKFFKYFDENSIDNKLLTEFNSQMKNKMISQEFFLILNKISFFQTNFQQSFLKKLAEKVSLVQFMPDQRIFLVFLIFYSKIFKKLVFFS